MLSQAWQYTIDPHPTGFMYVFVYLHSVYVNVFVVVLYVNVNVPLYACWPCMFEWCTVVSDTGMLPVSCFFSVAHQALVNTSKILHESIVLKYRRTDGLTGDCLRLLWNVSRGVPASAEFSIAVHTKVQKLRMYQ